jgi:hypothetical protein
MTQEPHPSDELGAAIRAAVDDVHASPALRARVEAERAARRRPGRRLPAIGLAGAAAALGCAAAIVLVLGLIGGDGRIEGPTIAHAADAALRPTAGPPPDEDPGEPLLIRAGIDGLRFPYWDHRFGLVATAVRSDHVGGRRAMTVEYRRSAERIGYTIVAGPALPRHPSAQIVRKGALSLAVFRHQGAVAVTWRRGGHTCVLASREAGVQRLLTLAAWTGGGRISGYAR